MKTPMQEMIDWLKSNLSTDLSNSQEFESKSTELLGKEKKAIVDAWYDGASSDPLPTHKNAERYYKEIYGT